MSIKAVLFDLDGTLLPMNQDSFLDIYFKNLTAHICGDGSHDPNEYVGAIWKGVKAMLTNDNSVTNEVAYFNSIGEKYGEECAKNEYSKYDEFYKTKYAKGKSECWHTPRSREIVDVLKEKGIVIALATNPVFPTTATNMRMGWVDLLPEDFALVTTCDNTGYSKPNPKYYLDIASKLGVEPKECLMVGNDVDDDMVAKTVGMDVFLLTDCLINKKEKDLSQYPSGSFDALKEYILKSI